MLKPMICVFSFLMAATVQAELLSAEQLPGYFEAAPERVVSYDLSVVDTLVSLGVTPVGVPSSVFTGHLQALNELPKAGSLFEPDVAALESLNPQLLIVGGRSRNTAEQLSKIAPTINFADEQLKFLEQNAKTSRSLGQLFAKEALVEKQLEQIQTNVAQLHDLTQNQTGLMLFTMNGNVMAHAPGDRFGYMHELTGLTPVLPAAKPNANTSRPEPNSPEAKKLAQERINTLQNALASNPDWLIVLDRSAINGGTKTAQETLSKHPVISQSAAFKDNRVIYVDPNGWYIIGSGLQNLTQITEQFLTEMQR